MLILIIWVGIFVKIMQFTNGLFKNGFLFTTSVPINVCGFFTWDKGKPDGGLVFIKII